MLPNTHALLESGDLTFEQRCRPAKSHRPLAAPSALRFSRRGASTHVNISKIRVFHRSHEEVWVSTVQSPEASQHLRLKVEILQSHGLPYAAWVTWSKRRARDLASRHLRMWHAT